MTATVDSIFDEYARRYTERDVEGVTNLCLWPSLLARSAKPCFPWKERKTPLLVRGSGFLLQNGPAWLLTRLQTGTFPLAVCLRVYAVHGRLRAPRDLM